MLGDTGQQGVAGDQPLDAADRQPVEITGQIDLLGAAIADK